MQPWLHAAALMQATTASVQVFANHFHCKFLATSFLPYLLLLYTLRIFYRACCPAGMPTKQLCHGV
jgi:hypothetical protein